MESSAAERAALLNESSVSANLELAYVLKDIAYDAWQTEPTRSVAAASALTSLANFNDDKQIHALADWVTGIACLVEGKMEQALVNIDAAEAGLFSLSMTHLAAATQVSKLVALGMLGRYGEALALGLRAREVFLQHGDLLAVGKIEHNLGNIYFRKDQYAEAERFQNSARNRFLELNDQIQLTKIENSLALTLAQQHKIRAADQLYRQALERALASDEIATQAAIESSIGMMALYDGRYEQALDYLERSRRKYVLLRMPHMSAMTEQEIADAYLELNLAPEAAEIYERVGKTFEELGMRAEQARALAYHGRAAIVTGNSDKAHILLQEARQLYKAEANEAGAAWVQITEAQLFYSQKDFETARDLASKAEPQLVASGAPRRFLFARWLRGEAARAGGLAVQASKELRQALADAETEEQADLAARCLTSLGLLAEAEGDTTSAEDLFKRAVGLIEEQRAPLAAEEFRTAYFSNKLEPYRALVRLCLADKKDRIGEALSFVENARARALSDASTLDMSTQTEPRDSFEASLLQRLEDLKQELNYLYNQINRNVGREIAPDRAETGRLYQAQRDRERKILEITRQLHHRGGKVPGHTQPFSIEQLQRQLGENAALIEYTAIDEELTAFVVTNDHVSVVRNLGLESEIATMVSQFRFQIETLRFGSSKMRKHLPLLADRAKTHLMSLYDKLVKPLTARVDKKALIIVPYRALNYLPFHALHDGNHFLIENQEVSYVPSARVLMQCLERPQQDPKSALLMGVADAQTPYVGRELESLQRIFPASRTFLNENATVKALQDNSSVIDVLHLACHAQFRSDNPLFSALRLGDGWLTVRDARKLKLKCQLVTLSACETGVNAIAPGEEIIGLTSGFISAGAPSLLMSLWPVDDESTGEFMADFYRQLCRLLSAPRALRQAQLNSLQRQSHPFFWSPFILVGR